MRNRLAALVLCGAICGLAQTFDAVSVKALGPNIQHGPGPGMTLGLKFTPARVSGKSQIPALLEEAYSIEPLQMELPDNNDLRLNVYEIAAVMPEGTSRETARLMLRSMLVERFGLRFHRETKEIPVYALTAGNGKIKLQSISPEQAKEKKIDTPTGPRGGFQSAGGRGWYGAISTSVEAFAAQMSTRLDRPVIDQTGLKGQYTIELKWDPSDDASLIAAIQQLGLKLERRKMPFEIFIVDHVDLTPTAN